MWASLALSLRAFSDEVYGDEKQPDRSTKYMAAVQGMATQVASNSSGRSAAGRGFASLIHRSVGPFLSGREFSSRELQSSIERKQHSKIETHDGGENDPFRGFLKIAPPPNTTAVQALRAGGTERRELMNFLALLCCIDFFSHPALLSLRSGCINR